MQYYFILLSFFLLFQPLNSFSASLLGKDYGILDPKHIQIKDKYKKDHFLSDDESTYSKDKIQLFLSKIIQERMSLTQDLSEAKVIETFENEVRANTDKNYKKGQKRKKSRFNPLVRAYDEYLIPKLKLMLEMANDPYLYFKQLEDTYDDFIRLYCLFYIPNTIRNQFYIDISPKVVIKHALKGFNISREYRKSKIHANNLAVEEKNKLAIQQCLNEPIEVGSYLNHDQLNILKYSCGYDISTINPGVSAWWKNYPTPQERLPLRDMHPEIFPTDKEKIYFKKVRLSSYGSPKLTAFYIRNGEKFEFKLKMGWEVNSDLATSMLLRFAGNNQDTMQYRSKVRIYLPQGFSYEKFRAEYEKKYGLALFTPYIRGHGKDGNNADDLEWVDIQDVLMERTEPGLIRVSNFNFRGWDNDDRREYRAQLLLWSWLNLMDSRIDNHKGLLRKTPVGWVPEHRIQDVGFSLGRNLHIRKKLDIVHEFRTYGVNNFEARFLQWDKHSVKIWHNDITFQQNAFGRTNYDDLKWMARNIARITQDEIRYSLEISHLPAPVVDLYLHKISYRRNQIVRAFGLENEFPLYNVPDLSTYSPNEFIKNGKIVVTHFPGHNTLEQNRTNIFTIMMEMLQRGIPLGQINNNFNAQLATVKLDGLVNPTPMSFSFVTPGIGIVLGREVGVNSQFLTDKEGKTSRNYYIRDTIGISIGGRTNNLLNTILTFLPISLRADVNVYRKELQYIHFADTLKKAWFARFNMFKIMRHFYYYVAHKLKPLEVIKVVDSYGFSFLGKFGGFDFDPFFVNRIEAGVGLYHVAPVFFHRNAFNQLQVYREKTTDFSLTSGIYAARINTMTNTLPLLGLGFTHNRFLQSASLYSFTLPDYNVDAPKNTWEQMEEEKRNFMHFMRGENHAKCLKNKVRQDLDFKAFGHLNRSNFGFLYFFQRDWVKGYSRVNIKIKNGDQDDVVHFHRVYHQFNQTKGIDLKIPYVGDTTLKERINQSLQIEMDALDPDNFVILLRSQKYLRSICRHHLDKIINRENALFSESDDKPFYRNFVLPPIEEIRTYKKVNIDNYIYFKGSGIINKLLTLNVDEFYQKLSLSQTRINKKSLVSSFRKLKQIAKLRSHHPKEFMMALVYFFQLLDINSIGTNVMRDIVGQDQMFVMGQLFGVYRGFSPMQRAEDKAVRRFAGVHWGEVIVPPVRYFLKWHRVQPESIYIDSALRIQDILGKMPAFGPEIY